MNFLVTSAVLALLGAVATRAAVSRLAPGSDPHAAWGLGLSSLVPAWVVVLVGLLGTTPGVHPQAVAGAAWVLSTAAALIGAIATEATLRRDAPRRTPHGNWRLGLLAVVPAWLIAVAGHVIG